MAQFDVHRNASKRTFAEFPYLLEIQSNLFEDSSRVVVIPLVLASAAVDKDSTLNPEFEVEAACVSLFPLDISSMNKNLLGETVATLRTKEKTVMQFRTLHTYRVKKVMQCRSTLCVEWKDRLIITFVGNNCPECEQWLLAQ